MALFVKGLIVYKPKVVLEKENLQKRAKKTPSHCAGSFKLV